MSQLSERSSQKDSQTHIKKQYKESLILENAETEPEDSTQETGSQKTGWMNGVNSRAMWHESEKGLPSYFSIELEKNLEKRHS